MSSRFCHPEPAGEGSIVVARAINHGRRSLTAKAVRDDKKLINMFHQYKPIIITLSIIALIIIATVQYVQSLINKPIDLSIQNNKLELLDSEPSDNIVIPKEFEFKGTKIALAWTDDNTGEDLIIQSDKKIYNGFNNIEVYFSITNTNKKDQNMDVVVWVGDERIRVEEMERIDTEGNGYSALALSAAAALSAGTVRKDIKGFTCGYTAQDNIESGKTNYYKVIIKYPPMSKGEFFIEAFGRNEGSIVPPPLARGGGLWSQGASDDGLQNGSTATRPAPVLRTGAELRDYGAVASYGHLDPWYNSNWSYWKKITIASNTVATTTSNFPVLATSTDSDLRTITHGGHVGQDNGYDIVFADSDGETLLNFEREKYASTTGEIIYWIKTDISSTTDKVLYMYYGNAGASDLATTTGAWDDDYVGVWHLAHDATASTSDSTKYGNDGTAKDNASSTPSGWVDGAFEFDGSGDCVDIGSNIGVATTSGTFSVWFTAETQVNASAFILAHKTDSENNRIYLQVETTDFKCGFGDNYHAISSNNNVENDGLWHYGTLIWDGTTAECFLDGNSLGTYVYILPNGTGSVFIGQTIDGWNFTGTVDEGRISNTARHSSWIETEYNNQVSVGSFMTFGEEVCVPKPIERSGGENVKIRIKGGTRIKGGVRF